MRDAERVHAGRFRCGERFPPGKLEGPLKPSHRDLDVVVRQAQLAHELKRPPLPARVADLDGERVALLGVSVAARDRTATEVDRGGIEQGSRSGQRRARAGGEHLVEPALRFDEIDPAHPERLERAAHAQGVIGPAIEQRVKRHAQVRRVLVESRRATSVFGERQRPLRVSVL